MASLVDHRGIVDWEEVQGLLAEAVFNGYVRGMSDFRDGVISFDHISEEVSGMNDELKERYYV